MKLYLFALIALIALTKAIPQDCMDCSDHETCCCDKFNQCECVFGGYCPEPKEIVSTFKSEWMTLAIQNSKGQWEIGDTVHSSELKKGEHVWFPDTLNTMKVEIVEHHDITENKVTCCVGLELGFPQCEAKVCCGNGCCC